MPPFDPQSSVDSSLSSLAPGSVDYGRRTAKYAPVEDPVDAAMREFTWLGDDDDCETTSEVDLNPRHH